MTLLRLLFWPRRYCLALALSLALVLGTATYAAMAKITVPKSYAGVVHLDVPRLCPISATVDITPETLQGASQGQDVNARISFPDGVPFEGGVRGIDVSSITLSFGQNSVGPALDRPWGYDNSGGGTIHIKFARAAVDGLLANQPEGDVTLVVRGGPQGCGFTASDTITWMPPVKANAAPALAPMPNVEATSTAEPTPGTGGDGTSSVETVEDTGQPGDGSPVTPTPETGGAGTEVTPTETATPEATPSPTPETIPTETVEAAPTETAEATPEETISAP